MKKIISLIRIAILFILSSIAMIFLFGEEQAESASVWIRLFVFDKVLVAATVYFAVMLYKYWSTCDQMFMAFDNMNDDDNPNPFQL